MPGATPLAADATPGGRANTAVMKHFVATLVILSTSFAAGACKKGSDKPALSAAEKKQIEQGQADARSATAEVHKRLDAGEGYKAVLDYCKLPLKLTSFLDDDVYQTERLRPYLELKVACHWEVWATENVASLKKAVARIKSSDTSDFMRKSEIKGLGALCEKATKHLEPELPTTTDGASEKLLKAFAAKTAAENELRTASPAHPRLQAAIAETCTPAAQAALTAASAAAAPTK